MLPVVDEPIVNVCLFVVPKFPAPVKNVLFPVVPAEIEAVGTPEFTFKKANLADALLCPPNVTSTVELFGNKSPAFWFQNASWLPWFDAIVMLPEPFVIVIPLPAVRVANV